MNTSSLRKTVAMTVGRCMISLAALVGWLQTAETHAQPPTPPPPPPTPVVEVRDLMQLFNKPLYMELKQVMKPDAAGRLDLPAIQASGLRAAEIANLVAIRPVKPPQDEWRQASGNLQRAGIALADAAKSQNPQATIRAYHDLVQRCNDCHQARAPGKAPQLKP